MADGLRAATWLAAGVCLVLAACGPPQGQPVSAPDNAPTVVAPGAGSVDSPTLRQVRVRGRLNCGVNQGLPGFAARDARGQWRGFDVDFCRAVAAAVLNDARLVNFLPQSAKTRFAALQAGQIDLLSRGASWSLIRDAGLGLDFAGISYFDGQSFLAPRRLNLRGPADLNGKRICVEAATTSATNLTDFARTARLRITPVPAESEDLARQAYETGACDVFSADTSALAAHRSLMPAPDDNAIMPGQISKEPLGPVVRQGDDQWQDIVRWTLNAMILGEEMGVTSRTVETARRRPASPQVELLVGGDGYGPLLGLRNDWAFQIIRQVGNYGEVFERNIGPDSPLKLERGMNALWNADSPGLLYAPPVR